MYVVAVNLFISMKSVKWKCCNILQKGLYYFVKRIKSRAFPHWTERSWNTFVRHPRDACHSYISASKQHRNNKYVRRSINVEIYDPVTVYQESTLQVQEICEWDSRGQSLVTARTVIFVPKSVTALLDSLDSLLHCKTDTCICLAVKKTIKSVNSTIHNYIAN